MLSLKQTSLLLFHVDNHSFINNINVNKGFFQKELVNLFRPNIILRYMQNSKVD